MTKIRIADRGRVGGSSTNEEKEGQARAEGTGKKNSHWLPTVTIRAFLEDSPSRIRGRATVQLHSEGMDQVFRGRNSFETSERGLIESVNKGQKKDCDEKAAVSFTRSKM